MADFELIKEIAIPSISKIVLLVIDGVGGLPHPQTSKTELETAATPNLDKLAGQSICGLSEPVSPGITPGSGPGHLSLFGYDPLKFIIGRGVLEALGIGFDLEDNDVAARGNFCSINDQGEVTDRRAGRIPTENNAELCKLLNGWDIEGVRTIVRPVKEHRFVAVFRGEQLAGEVTDSDPQKTGVPPEAVTAVRSEAERMAHIANEFLKRAQDALSQHQPANMVLLRGFSKHPHFPAMGEVYGLSPAAIAGYPMYRGLAKLVGMKLLNPGAGIGEEFMTLKKHYNDYDFFFLHIKDSDSAGEDGDFQRKVSVIEEVDSLIPLLNDLEPDVLAVTGDHSTPSVLKSHSWHPVPVMLCSKWCRRDAVNEFSESACLSGGLGHIPATEFMPLAMANALKLTKFGA